MFCGKKTTVHITKLLNSYFAIILVKNFYVGGEAVYALAMKEILLKLSPTELLCTKFLRTVLKPRELRKFFWTINKSFSLVFNIFIPSFTEENNCFVRKSFCLVTENRFMVFNTIVSQRILVKASPVFLWRIKCGMSFKFILCLKD